MAYYTAVLARSGGQWQLRPSDIDAPEDLADVSDAVRVASRGRGGLAIVEREDEWFAIVRVDGEDDPRIFVSDLPAARQGPFAVLFEDVEEWERPSGTSATEPEPTPAAPSPQSAVAAHAVDDVSVIDQADQNPDELMDDQDLEDADLKDDLDDLEAVDGLDDVDEDLAEDLTGSAVDGTGGRASSTDSGVALAPAPLEDVVWAGDLGVLEDYGLAPQTLKLIVEDGDPSAALLAIGEQAGFADVIDEWH